MRMLIVQCDLCGHHIMGDPYELILAQSERETGLVKTDWDERTMEICNDCRRLLEKVADHRGLRHPERWEEWLDETGDGDLLLRPLREDPKEQPLTTDPWYPERQ